MPRRSSARTRPRNRTATSRASTAGCGGTPDPAAVPDEIAEVRRAAERLLDHLRRHPNVGDRHRFGEQVLQEADARVVAERISMWAPLGGGYELLAADGPEPLPRSSEVAEDQRSFSEIRTRSDAVYSPA